MQWEKAYRPFAACRFALTAAHARVGVTKNRRASERRTFQLDDTERTAIHAGATSIARLGVENRFWPETSRNVNRWTSFAIVDRAVLGTDHAAHTTLDAKLRPNGV